MSKRFELDPDLTPEQQLVVAVVALQRDVTEIKVDAKETKHILTGNGHPEHGLVFKVEQLQTLLRREKHPTYWKRIAYDVLKQTGALILTTAVLGFLALTLLGAQDKLHLLIGTGAIK